MDKVSAAGTNFLTVLSISAVSPSLAPLALTTVNVYPTPYVDLRNMEEPTHWSWPWAMMAILSPKMSASSMKCVVRRMMRPLLFFCRMFHVLRLLYGSMPEVGSSKMTTLLSPIRAIPTESFLFMPPESCFEVTFLFSVSPTSAMIFSTSAETLETGTPLKMANMRRCCATVRSANRTSCWGHTPMEVLISGIFSVIFFPMTSASPEVLLMSPVSIEMVVDFPAPLWPRSTVIWPSNMSRLKLLTAILSSPVVLKTFLRFLMLRLRFSEIWLVRSALTGSCLTDEALSASSPSRGSERPSPAAPSPPPPKRKETGKCQGSCVPYSLGRTLSK
mmetsp:Transcript_14291/g.29201  ORF Transcript_14291/g.29201 Transcript_14291/m.29201 type:complete len:332 (+) Transcript_14291:3232-4227(+)